MYAKGRNVVSHAVDLAKRVHEKIDPVMLPGSSPLVSSENKEPETWPPLFNELRMKMQSIEQSLNSIEDALTRTEL